MNMDQIFYARNADTGAFVMIAPLSTFADIYGWRMDTILRVHNAKNYPAFVANGRDAGITLEPLTGLAAFVPGD